MAEYIDRDDLIRKHSDDVTNWGEPYAIKISSIKAAAAVDVIPVVRCENCRWFKENWCNEVMARPIKPTDFCSYFEPKEIKEALHRAREEELNQCLAWLQCRMDEYDDKEAYQDDYRIVAAIWDFMRSKMLTKD